MIYNFLVKNVRNSNKRKYSLLIKFVLLFMGNKIAYYIIISIAKQNIVTYISLLIKSSSAYTLYSILYIIIFSKNLISPYVKEGAEKKLMDFRSIWDVSN